MKTNKLFAVLMGVALLLVSSCTDVNNPNLDETNQELEASIFGHHGQQGALTANGWYEEEEIYYILNGVEEGVIERGENDIYLIGGDRLHQANVVEFIPGEPGYSPHWNVYIVHSAEGVTVQDILESGYASSHYTTEGVLFDDVEDLRDAREANLVTFFRPGIVVHCPIISEKGAEAPGNTELPEVFTPFGSTF